MARKEIPYDGKPPEGAPFITEDGRSICGGRKRGTEFRCQAIPAIHPISGEVINGRCVLHGGNINVGRPLRNGRGSKFAALLGGDLGHRVGLAFEDPESGSLGEHIALTEGRIEDLLARIAERSPGPEVWKEMEELMEKVQGGGDQALQALEQLGDVIRQGAHIPKMFSEVDRLQRHLVTLGDSDVKRTMLKREFIPRKMLRLVMVRVLEAFDSAVNDEIEDERLAGKLVRRFRSGLGSLAPIGALPGAGGDDEGNRVET